MSPASCTVARRFRMAALLSGFLVVAAGLLAPGATPTADAASAPSRPFASNSPFNVAIRSAPAIDTNSKAMIARASRTGQVNANMFEFGIPIVTAGSTSPKYNVSCRMSPAWGTCPFSGQKMPIPTSAKPSQGSDAALVVIDPATKTIGEYWQATRTSNSWVASWGAVNSLTGSGWGGASTGAGASRLGGVIRVSEIQAGVINHALVLQTDNVCKTKFRAPAVKTDGNSTRSDCIPEGARLQLNPAINVDAIPGITRGERIVAKAMQKYGGYVIDYAGTAMSVSFEVAPDASWSSPGSVYQAAGLSWDYYGMPHVPWKQLRVLKAWNG